MTIPRWLRRIGLGLLGLGLLIALFYAEEDWRGAREWARVKKELQARGEPLQFPEMPPVPDDQNVAAAPIFAEYFSAMASDNSERIHNTAFWKIRVFIHQPGVMRPTLGAVGSKEEFDVVRWQKYFTGKENSMTAATDILAALQPYDQTIREVRQALDRPAIRWSQSLLDPIFSNRFPQLEAALDVASFLPIRALAEIEAGQSDAAIDDLELQLRLSASLNSNPVLLCHMVSVSIDKLSYVIVIRGLEKRVWNDVQLRRVESVLAERNPLTDFQKAMKGERVFFLEEMTSVIKNPGKWINYQQGLEYPRSFWGRIEGSFFTLIPTGWLDFNQAYYCKGIESDFIDPIHPEEGRVDLALVTSSFAKENSREHGLARSSVYSFFWRLVMPSLHASLSRAAYDQAILNAARTACALEDYRLQNGHLPATLDALVPTFLPALPPDPVADGPLHYVPSGDDDYLLYSIGWNGKDDGGVIARKPGSTAPDLDNGDWVWASRPSLYRFVESPPKAGS